MPGGKQKLAGRFTGGATIGSGSVVALMKTIWAGSVVANSPSFSAASSTGSTEQLSLAVTGLTASMVVFVTPASMPGSAVVLKSACVIADKIETVWLHAGSAAISGCAVTLQYLAIQT